MCSDACRCQLCERRNNGTRSMLKTVPSSAGAVRQVPASSRSLMASTTYQTPANPTTVSRTPDISDSTSEAWQAYGNGGAATNDAREFKMMKDKEAQYLATVRNTPPPMVPSSSKSAKLIKVSPEKKAAPKNLNLLIDLDLNFWNSDADYSTTTAWI